MNAPDVDVVVVGGGGCGLAAALAAAEAGASVAVLEKLDRPGGNTELSTGSIPAADSKYQRAAGIEDSPELMAADLLRQSGSTDAEHLVRALAAGSAALVEWLVERHQVDLRLITDYKHVGHSVPRLHAPPDRRGSSLMRDLLAAVARAGVEVAVGNPVVELLKTDGRVTGVRVAGPRSGEYTLRCNAVVLGANGFGNNKDMLRTWIPEIAEAQYFGAEGSTGEAVDWCAAERADLGNMGAYQGYAAVAYPHGCIVSWTTVEKGGLLLSPEGRRMGDESVGYSGFAPVVSSQAEMSYVVFDKRIRDFVAGNEPEFAELADIGGVVEAATAADVAHVLGAPEDVVSEFSRGVRGGSRWRGDGRVRSHRLRDGSAGTAVLRGPVDPAIFHTQGGAMVDERARVLRADGSHVPGLYAGGGVAAGLSGARGAAGYSSGNGLLSAVGLGRIAGGEAAALSRAG